MMGTGAFCVSQDVDWDEWVIRSEDACLPVSDGR